VSARAQRSSLLIRLLVSLGLLLGALLVFHNRQPLYDQLMVWQYQPTPQIVSISDRSAMSDRGIFLFYASWPELLGRDSFNDACRSVRTEQTAVLGCYTMNRIHLFDIDNKALDGIKEVTAAHEMLHAAYQRLPKAKKDHVNALLAKQSFGADEARLTELLAEYDKSEPGERLNELHSILGSELRTLDPELEAYYAEYFSDRSKLVALSEQYQSVFSELKNRQESLVSELNALADAIEQQGAVYKRNLQVLSSDVDAFNAEARSGQMTREAYDAKRDTLEAKQARLETEYDAIQSLIAQYDQKRTELASINSESNALNRSINSSFAPVPDAIDG
jgi:DNA repair exonuclease SbcCD ATPase subunit